MFVGNPEDRIIMNKEGKYLILRKPTENERAFRYDLSTGKIERINYYKTIDTKYTPVSVKNITAWFKDGEIVTEDLHFARLVVFLSHDAKLRRYKSPIRFIQHLDAQNGRIFEEWDGTGVKFKDIERFFKDFKEGRYHYNDGTKAYHNIYFRYRPSDFSKEKLNYIKELGELDSYKDLYNIYHESYENLIILRDLRKYEENPQYSDVFGVKRSYYSSDYDTVSILNDKYNNSYMRNNLLNSIKNYNLELEAFVRFLNRLRRTEGVTIDDLLNGNHYGDYLRMELALKHNVKPKMNKYPRNFMSVWHLTKKEYRYLREQIDEEAFKRQCDKFRELEYIDGKYQIVVPESKVEIEIEADELKHCVRSYIGSVVEGRTLIVFCRFKKDPEKPLVTIEVKNGYITQAYAINDTKPSDESLNFIRKWARKNNLKISWCWR